MREFYSNIHGFDFLVPLFITCVRGTRIVVTPDIVSDVLCVPRVEHPDYLGCDRLRPCLKMSLFLLFVSALLIGVSISSLTVWALLKALVFLTWL